MLNKKKTGPLIIFLASLLWALDSPFRKPLLVGGLTASFITFLEHGINFFVSLPGLILKRAEFIKVSRKQWVGLLYIGIGSSALGAVLFVKGVEAMNYNFTIAALLQKLQPLFAITFAVIFLKEKLHSKFWLYALPALLGAYWVSFGFVGPAKLWQEGAVNFLGSMLAIGAAILWAGGTTVGKSLVKDLDVQFVNGARFFFGFIFLMLFVGVSGSFQFDLMTLKFWLNTGIIALLTGFFPLLIYYYGLRHTKVSVATFMELGYPVAFTVVNWVFLGITLNVWQIVGALVLLISVSLLVLETNKHDS